MGDKYIFSCKMPVKKARWCLRLRKLIDKYKPIPLPVKATAWFFICSVIQKMVSVISTVVFTRLMSTEDYGLISIYNSWADILLTIASLNLFTACFNVGMTKYEDEREQWVSSLQILAIISTTIFSVLFIGLYYVFEQYINLPIELIITMSISFYFSTAISLWTAKQRYELSYVRMVTVTIGYTIMVFALSLFAILISEQKGAAKIIGTTIATSIFGIVLLVSNISKSKPIANKEFMKFALVYNLQMMPAFLGAVVLSQIDRVMIDRMVNREAAGIYSVAYNAAFMISIVSSAISATYNPWMIQKVKRNDYSKADRIGNGLSFMFLIVILLFIICAPDFIKIMAPKEYMEAIYIIPAVAGSTFFSLIYFLYCPVPQYHLKAKQLSIITASASVLNVVLNYYAIRRWGYTTYICYLLYGWGTALYSIYLLKKEGFQGQIYNLQKLVGMTLILTVAVIIVPFTYKGYLLRYAVLVLIAVISVINFKKIIKPFFEIRKE